MRKWRHEQIFMRVMCASNLMYGLPLVPKMETLEPPLLRRRSAAVESQPPPIPGLAMRYRSSIAICITVRAIAYQSHLTDAASTEVARLAVHEVKLDTGVRAPR